MVYRDAAERAGSIDADKMVTALENTDYVGAAYRIVYLGMDSPFPHDVKSGPGYAIVPLVQWVKGEQLVIWPPSEWKGEKYEGVSPFRIPPWMVSHFKK